MVAWFVNFFRGYLVCLLEERQGEDLLNRWVRQGIEIWDVKRKNGFLQFSVMVADYRRFLANQEEIAENIYILEKHGLPFFWPVMWTRWLFWSGGLVFVAALIILSQMILEVEVKGIENIAEEDVLREAAALGLEEGVFRFRLPPQEVLSSELLQRIEGVSWISVDLKGTTATIQLAESARPPETRLQNPRHLVAKKDAIIHEIYVEKGIGIVKRHQRVKKGDILISGLIGAAPSQEGGDEAGKSRSQMVTAKGVVEGIVWYEANVTVPLQQKHLKLTGDQRTEYALIVGGRLITWPHDDTPFEMYKKENYALYWTLREQQLPIGLYVSNYYAATEVLADLSPEEAVQLGAKRARDQLKRNLPENAEITVEKVLHKEVKNGKVKMKMYYEVIEDITSEKPIIQGE